MNKLGKYLLIGILLIAAIFILWWINSLAAAKEDFYTGVLNRRGNTDSIVAAFTMALWLHDDIAYEITDRSLWGELDKWMNTHTRHECSIFNPGQLDIISSPANPDGAHSYFSCYEGGISLDEIQTRQDSSGKWYITNWEIDP